MKKPKTIDLEGDEYKIFGPLCGTKKEAKNDFEITPKKEENIMIMNFEIKSVLEPYITIYQTAIKNVDFENCKQQIFYLLKEDLYILCELYKNHTYKDINDRLSYRNVSGLRKRYNCYLKLLKNRDHKLIADEIKNSGLINQRLLVSSKGVVSIKNESKVKQKSDKIEKEISIEDIENISDEKEEEKENNESSKSSIIQPISPSENSENSSSSNSINEIPSKKIKKEELIIKNEQSSELKNNFLFPTLEILQKIKNPILPFNNNESQIFNMLNESKDKFKIIRDMDDTRRSCVKEELSQIFCLLLEIKSHFKKELKIIVSDLSEVSGNIDDLIEYYSDEKEKSYLLWRKDEDEQLDKCTNKEDSGFKLLLRFKGEERVKRRMIYRKLNKNFLL